MFYGLDVHKDFIQVCCINESNTYRNDFTVETSSEKIEEFAYKLEEKDQAVLESTFNSWSVYNHLKTYSSATIKVAHARDIKAIAHAKVKTDKVDAHILAQLLRMDFIPEVKMPGDQAWETRQLGSHRRFLGKNRTAIKNSIHAILHKNFLKCPSPTLFSQKGRKWLVAQKLKEHESMMLDHLLELLDQVDRQISEVDVKFQERAKKDQNVRLLMTIPGIGVTVATGLLAAIDDIERFQTSQQLASYFGLTPRIRQSGYKAYFGSISKEGTAYGRWLAVEAAQALALSAQSPLVATYHRVKKKKGHNVAVVALARKIIVLVWHILQNKTPYRYADPIRTRAKLRELDPSKRTMEPWEARYKSIDQIYEEFKLPLLPLPSKGERLSAQKNRRHITLARKMNASKKKDEKIQIITEM